MYLYVTIPGIIGVDAPETQCPGFTASSQFPTISDGSGNRNPCKSSDEAALLKYLPDDYNELSAEGQADAIKEAKDRWRKETYGAARELGTAATRARIASIRCAPTWATPSRTGPTTSATS